MDSPWMDSMVLDRVWKRRSKVDSKRGDEPLLWPLTPALPAAIFQVFWSRCCPSQVHVWILQHHGTLGLHYSQYYNNNIRHVQPNVLSYLSLFLTYLFSNVSQTKRMCYATQNLLYCRGRNFGLVNSHWSIYKYEYFILLKHATTQQGSVMDRETKWEKQTFKCRLLTKSWWS